VLLAAGVTTGLTLEDASYSSSGNLSFSFSYRGLYRTKPQRGELVEVRRLSAEGRLADSFAVAPLHLPPYVGGASAELPLYASSYIRSLEARYQGFVLRAEGKTRVNMVPAYNVLYTARVRGQLMFGRNVLLVPQRPGARKGVEIVMLTAPWANREVTSPLEVASTGVLLKPVKTFTLA
jgi:hypothetical protein